VNLFLFLARDPKLAGEYRAIIEKKTREAKHGDRGVGDHCTLEDGSGNVKRIIGPSTIVGGRTENAGPGEQDV